MLLYITTNSMRPSTACSVASALRALQHLEAPSSVDELVGGFLRTCRCPPERALQQRSRRVLRDTRSCCPPTRTIRAAGLSGSTTPRTWFSTIPSRGRLHQAHASCRRAGDCRFAGWSPPVGWAPHPWMTWAAAVAVSLAERRKTMAPAVALASPWTVALGQGRFRRPPRPLLRRPIPVVRPKPGRGNGGTRRVSRRRLCTMAYVALGPSTRRGPSRWQSNHRRSSL